MANEFDDIIPNTQTPRGGRLGTPENRWDELHATSGECDILVLHKQFILNGQTVSGVISYDQAQFIADLNGLSNSYLIIHNLGTKYVDVSIYDRENDKVIANNINLLDSMSFQLEFVELQAGTVLVQKGKE